MPSLTIYIIHRRSVHYAQQARMCNINIEEQFIPQLVTIHGYLVQTIAVHRRIVKSVLENFLSCGRGTFHVHPYPQLRTSCLVVTYIFLCLATPVLYIQLHAAVTAMALSYTETDLISFRFQCSSFCLSSGLTQTCKSLYYNINSSKAMRGSSLGMVNKDVGLQPE